MNDALMEVWFTFLKIHIHAHKKSCLVMNNEPYYKFH